MGKIKTKIALICIVFSLGMCVCGFRGLAQDKDIVEESVPPAIRVTGVIYDGKPVTIVNGQVVKEGDVIGEVKVIKVTESEVEFEYRGNTFVRKLGNKPASGYPLKSKVKRKSRGSWKELFNSELFKIRTKRDVKKLKAVVEKNFFKMIGIIWLLFIAIYVYTSVTLQKIADKTGTENSWLAWIPIANLYLQCEIADKPAWWMLLLFIPYLNLIVIIILWAGIARARGKSGWLGMFILFPILNFIVMGYLAFARNNELQNSVVDNKDIQDKPSSDIIGR